MKEEWDLNIFFRLYILRMTPIYLIVPGFHPIFHTVKCCKLILDRSNNCLWGKEPKKKRRRKNKKHSTYLCYQQNTAKSDLPCCKRRQTKLSPISGKKSRFRTDHCRKCSTSFNWHSRVHWSGRFIGFLPTIKSSPDTPVREPQNEQAMKNTYIKKKKKSRFYAQIW